MHGDCCKYYIKMGMRVDEARMEIVDHERKKRVLFFGLYAKFMKEFFSIPDIKNIFAQYVPSHGVTGKGRSGRFYYF